jgi:hypothetical protein
MTQENLASRDEFYNISNQNLDPEKKSIFENYVELATPSKEDLCIKQEKKKLYW